MWRYPNGKEPDKGYCKLYDELYEKALKAPNRVAVFADDKGYPDSAAEGFAYQLSGPSIVLCMECKVDENGTGHIYGYVSDISNYCDEYLPEVIGRP